MTAARKFDEIVTALAADLTARGFRRKGVWFTRRPFEDERFWCLGVRKIPQSASKRVVFQIMARAGRTGVGDVAPIGALAHALKHASFEHHLTDGPKEILWTVWPSTDVTALSVQVIETVVAQSLPALAAHTF